MKDKAICPYYGQNEDTCDVGCGYITSHDAKMIITFCSAGFANCQKYRQLSGRQTAEGDSSRSVTMPMPVDAQPPPVFGLFSLGATAALFALDQLPVISLDLHAMALLLFLGALCQMTTGLSALKKNPIRAVAFTGFGLFWLSLLALDILPRAGYGELPGRLPMVGYLAMWGLFSMILCQGMESMSRLCRLVFVMLTAFLMLLAVAHASGNTAVLHSAATVGLVSGLPGMLLGLRHCWREINQSFHPELRRSGRLR